MSIVPLVGANGGGDYTQTAAGLLNIQITGDGASNNLTVAGNASFAGSLNVLLAAGYRPGNGQNWFIMNYAGALLQMYNNTNVFKPAGFNNPTYPGGVVQIGN